MFDDPHTIALCRSRLPSGTSPTECSTVLALQTHPRALIAGAGGQVPLGKRDLHPLRRHSMHACLGMALLVVAILFAGCSKGASVQSFNPQTDTARTALEKALTSWQNGQAKPGLI